MTHQRSIAIIGLGYVGLEIMAAFGQKHKILAFDVNEERVKELKNGYDKNEEVSSELLKSPNITYTTNPDDFAKADFFIVAVPTPINQIRHPDIYNLREATRLIGKYLKKGDIVVYESTVYPGATEEICVPVLEKTSGLVCGKDFSVGYSPERINPADKQHDIGSIIKIVSGFNPETLEVVADVYSSVIKAGVHRAPSMRVAEAAKVIENTQRDINIAFMNDIAILLHKLNMDTVEVINAMKTKWNYVHFQPGLVGGHCIGFNSYYLLHKADEVNYSSDIIMAGRRVNEYISKFIVSEAVKNLVHLDIPIKHSRVAILGLTYKENCSDLRDTKVIDVISELKSFGIKAMIHDPIANVEQAKRVYGIDLIGWNDLHDLDALILTVSHKEYLELSKEQIIKMLNPRGLFMDIKEIYSKEDFAGTNITFWRL